MTGFSTTDPSLMTEPWTGTVERPYFTDDMSPTEDWDSSEETTDNILSCFSIFISLWGLVGNGIIICFLGFRIQRNKYTIYILNLAVADFLFLLCSSVALLLNLPLIAHHHFPHVPQQVHRVLHILYVFGYNTNQYLLTAISAERCLSILYPLWYRCWRPKHLSTALCAVLWALASLVTGIEYFFCTSTFYFPESPTLQAMKPRSCPAVSIFTGVLTFLVFTPIMVTSSLTLLIKVQTSSQRRNPPKFYIIIVFSVALFLTCSLSFRLFLFIENYYYHELLNDVVFDCFLLLSIFNSCINPVVYFYLGNCRVRRPLKEVLQGVFKDDII
uniref:Mas-related G-protein coupled receptor member H-like n=1 Tax=Geotrypetes seraphini TaxID=260995 RepID=A0A6P8NX63_GEOSA|nr:mas-related G-protein coupled receptor member H-like [Geotrypetes seraphini]